MSAIYKSLNLVLNHFNTILFNFISFLVVWQVICRFILKIPSPWTEEIARYTLVCVTFLGAAIATRDGTHLVALEALAWVPPVWRFLNKLIIEIAILWVSVLLFLGSLTIVEIGASETATSLEWLPMSYVYAVLPVSFGLISLYTLINLVKLVLGFVHSERQGDLP